MTTLEDMVQEKCDFCECTWDGDLDDPLVPLHLGEPPQPQPVTSRGIQDDNRESWQISQQSQLEAIINALDDMGGMEYEIHKQVHEVKAVGGETHFAKATDGGEMYFDSEPEDKTAAELRFHPEAREVEPDAMVCQECAEMFRNLREE